jgi:hypothetical protein
MRDDRYPKIGEELDRWRCEHFDAGSNEHPFVSRRVRMRLNVPVGSFAPNRISVDMSSDKPENIPMMRTSPNAACETDLGEPCTSAVAKYRFHTGTSIIPPHSLFAMY